MDISGSIEIISQRLYYVNMRRMPMDSEDTHFFSVDDTFVFQPFFADFGPLHLGHTYRFCVLLDAKLKDPALEKKRIYFFSSHDGHKRANSAMLICAYSMLRLGKNSEDAYAPFLGVYPPFIPFRDASLGISTFNLTIMDCLRGLEKAIFFKFFDFDSFDVDWYEYHEKVENGDFNWIIPGKFLAFSGPGAQPLYFEGGFRTWICEDYIPVFRKLGITHIVRLNKKVYERKKFIDAGFKHIELFFPDGSCPSDAIVRKFLNISESAKGGIAVHCKAGLGRTGSLIACYIMKHYKFTASEVIGWLRLVRPGSVIGPQQNFLKQIQPRLWKSGDRERSSTSADDAISSSSTGFASQSSSSRGHSQLPSAGSGVSKNKTSSTDRSIISKPIVQRSRSATPSRSLLISHASPGDVAVFSPSPQRRSRVPHSVLQDSSSPLCPSKIKARGLRNNSLVPSLRRDSLSNRVSAIDVTQPVVDDGFSSALNLSSPLLSSLSISSESPTYSASRRPSRLSSRPFSSFPTQNGATSFPSSTFGKDSDPFRLEDENQHASNVRGRSSTPISRAESRTGNRRRAISSTPIGNRSIRSNVSSVDVPFDAVDGLLHSRGFRSPSPGARYLIGKHPVPRDMNSRPSTSAPREGRVLSSLSGEKKLNLNKKFLEPNGISVSTSAALENYRQFRENAERKIAATFRTSTRLGSPSESHF